MKLKQIVRKLITKLEFRTRRWAFSDYKPTQQVPDHQYYVNQKIQLERYEKLFGVGDRYLEEEKCYIENRLWELEDLKKIKMVARNYKSIRERPTFPIDFTRKLK